MVKSLNRRRFCSPSPIIPPAAPKPNVWFPDFSAEETILNVGEDELPNTLELLKRPEFATALHEFAANVEFYQSPIDTSELSDEDLANSIFADTDLNNRFWSFYDEAKLRYEQSKDD